MMLFVDIEGTPMQELAAIVCDESHAIIDVFHAFVFYPFEVDKWSRLHIHGLNPTYLHGKAYRNPNSLRQDFYKWLGQYSITGVYANNPKREERELKLLSFSNIDVLPWEKRHKNSSYKLL